LQQDVFHIYSGPPDLESAHLGIVWPVFLGKLFSQSDIFEKIREFCIREGPLLRLHLNYFFQTS